MRWPILHRLTHEQKVLAVLDRTRPLTPEELLVWVYDDVPPRVHRVALRSLVAHLEKLVAEGQTRVVGGRYLAA